MLRYAAEKGVAGIIVDGCLRDLEGIEKLEMPVYAKGITPQGPYKNGPGEINVPIACGGQVVFPGDILVGDRDGIVVIRPHDANLVYQDAQEKKKKEDITFSKMDKDINLYAEAHRLSTEKRMQGKNVSFI